MTPARLARAGFQVLEKNKPYRNPSLIAAVDGMACIRCGRQDGTVVPAHYSGICASLLGKGVGVKAHDFVAAYCLKCHTEADSYKVGNDYEAGFFRLMDILKTLQVMLRDGKIKIEVIN